MPPATAVDREQVRKHVARTAAIAGLGGFLVGYDTAVIAGALLYIAPHFGLGSVAAGIAVAALPVGAVLGAVVSGRAADRWGRRTVILGSAVIFVIGALASAAAPTAALLAVARVVLGVATGLASAAAPVYVSEIAPPAGRGRLVTYFQLAVTIGIVAAYGAGLAFGSSEGWRLMLGLGALPAIALGLGIARAPQSPRWLVTVRRDDDARRSLAEIREGGEEEAASEVESIRTGLRTGHVGEWRDLLRPAVRAALVVGVGLAILQQVSGINTVIYYAPTIFKFAGIGSSAAAIVASIGVGIVNIAMTVVAIRLLDRVGRRPLLLWGSAVMGLALTALALVSALGAKDGAGPVVAIVSLMVYVGAFAISLGPIFWLLNSELYPLGVRSKAAAVGTMTSWLFTFIVSLSFLPLVDALGRDGVFFLYAAICALTFVFCKALVPETKGKTLEQIQEVFRSRAGVAT